MNFDLKLGKAASVLFLALAMAGCGGGGGTTETTPETPVPDPAIKQRADIATAIGTAQTAVAAVNNDSTDTEVKTADDAITIARGAITAATNVPAEERAANTGTVNALASRLTAAKTARTMAMNDKAKADRMAMDAMAMKLHAGLDPAATGAGAALNSASVVVAATGVTGDPDGTAGNDDDVTFKKTDTMVMGYGDWKGADYVVKTNTMTDHAVVYTNQGAGKQVPIADKHGGTGGILGDNGRIAQAGLATNAALIAGSDFASGSGGKDHTEADGDNTRVRGTFDSADGWYQCAQSGTTACRSQVDGLGGLILSGGWNFDPDDHAMVPEAADTDYVAYGWWSREVTDGVDVMAFVNTLGAAAVASTTNTVTGTAMYMGGAAGKYAISNPLGSDSEAGAFTAKAMLTAKFGDSTDEGTVSGMLTDFRSGGMDKDWTVTLKGAGTNEGAALATGVIGGGLTEANQTGQTVWSIGETPASAAGNWGGSFYDAGTGVGDAPMTAAGIFRAEYGTIGRMYGAFGVTKEE